MAISAVMGAISAGTTALSGGVLLGGFLVGGAGTLLTHFLVSTAMGAALNALSPKPSNSTGGYTISGVSGSSLDHQIIYGETRVGGVRIYDESTGTNNKILHRVIGFAGHEIDSYTAIYLNEEIVTLDGSGNVTSPARYSGKVRIKTYLGTDSQTADTDLTSESAFWTANHRLRGIAYVYARFTYDQNAFANGVPTVSAKIKGRRVYDPRSGLTAWSKNSALCIRDYLTAPFGLSQASVRIDDALVTIAADVADETVSAESRYTCSGSFLTSVAPGSILSSLLTSMGGILWYSQGKWRMKAAKWVAPTISFDEGDVRSQLSISTRNSRRDNFNVIKGTFKGPETDWQETDYPRVTDAAFLAADNGLENTTDYDLPFTDSSKTAQRIAKIALFRNREQLSISASFGLKAMKVQVGDIISLSLDRFGWVSKAFEVTSWNMSVTEELDIQFPLTLREISEQVFQDVSGSVFEMNNTTLPNPYYVEPVGISLSSEVRIQNENIIDFIYILITASDSSMIDYVEVQYKKSTDSVWSVAGTGDIGIYELPNPDSVDHDFRARSFNHFGVQGDWTYYLDYASVGLIAAPEDVSNFRANLNGGVISLEWDPVSDLDLSHYRIRHSLEETGATYANSTGSVTRVSRPASSVTVPTRPGTYTIKAYDKLGNASINYSSVVVREAALETFSNNLTSTQSPTFSGTKTNTSVTSSQLRLTTFSSGPSVGEYEFTTYIDTGAVRRVRSRIDMNVVRLDTAAGLWDDIPGNWDSFPGNWDDWTGAAQFTDTDVITYISVTEQDPAGTPTWSAWQIFKAGDFYGRAFKFKIELQSETNNVTPSISGLVARVQY